MGETGGDNPGLYPARKPQQNAYIERFFVTARCATTGMGHYLFESLNELQEFATNWLWVYKP